MSPRDAVYVGHVLDTARKAVGKTRGLSRQAYDNDENLRLALIHLVQVFGEAARQVSREFSDAHPEIPWADIVGMRHKVAQPQRSSGRRWTRHAHAVVLGHRTHQGTTEDHSCSPLSATEARS